VPLWLGRMLIGNGVLTLDEWGEEVKKIGSKSQSS
jgi:hypothetical protein